MDDRAKREQEELQRVVNQAVNKIASALSAATGTPAKAVILVVHFPEDVLFGVEVQAERPQVQMNAIDAMLDHLRRARETIKAGILASRPKPPGTITQ